MTKRTATGAVDKKTNGFITETMAAVEERLTEGLATVGTGSFSVTIAVTMNQGGISRASVEQTRAQKIS